MQFTACYTKLEEGYMGQILEWPNVITSGKDLDECEYMLKDAAHEMMLAYEEDGERIPHPFMIVRPISLPVKEEMVDVELPSEKELLVHVS